MEKIDNQCNYEVELNLLDVLSILRKNCFTIIKIVLTFVFASVFYCFAIAKPIYQNYAIIRIPANTNNQEYVINTCIELLHHDGIATVSGLGKSSLIKLYFTANSVEDVKKKANEYLPVALRKVDKIVQEAGFLIYDADKEKYIKSNSITVTGNTSEIINPAMISKLPISPNKKKIISLAGVLGILTGSIYVILKHIIIKNISLR